MKRSIFKFFVLKGAAGHQECLDWPLPRYQYGAWLRSERKQIIINVIKTIVNLSSSSSMSSDHLQECTGERTRRRRKDQPVSVYSLAKMPSKGGTTTEVSVNHELQVVWGRTLLTTDQSSSTYSECYLILRTILTSSIPTPPPPLPPASNETLITAWPS